MLKLYSLDNADVTLPITIYIFDALQMMVFSFLENTDITKSLHNYIFFPLFHVNCAVWDLGGKKVSFMLTNSC